ncbi:G-type lectin S-receptor-like serine/threonine-protein kinase RKS1 isoform X1 [Populus alba x Populus x berolinensis]|nr:G-type lectin S-receptor-like serine/threonine-protein kinase RKS1 isoform X1 [Populus alba x Populus x berolinensis]
MEAEKLFLLFSLLRLQFSSCTSQDSLKTNQTIKEGDLLISKGDIFALGFFSPGSSTNRYLGIWYHKIPKQTVVWVANRNDPIFGSSGFLFIDQYGNLVLYGNDDQKLLVWSTSVSVEENDTCEAHLLDSGNLILVRKRSRKTVWQSFDYPTNIQLPGMKLGLDRKLGTDRFLTSWRSADDPGIGDFSMRMNPNGSPQFFLYNVTKPITRAPPWPWRNQMSLYTSTFVNDPDEKYCFYTVPDDSYLLRIIVDHSGVTKALTWRQSDGRWKEYWKSPQFQCDYYGHCGAYSTCELANINEFGCACLPGFEPKYPLEWSTRDGSGGCVRKRLQTSSVCDHGEGFVKVEKVILPDTSAAAWVDMSRSRADCEVECKRNCSCSAYAVIVIPGKGEGCLNWYKELVDIKYDRSESRDLKETIDVVPKRLPFAIFVVIFPWDLISSPRLQVVFPIELIFLSFHSHAAETTRKSNNFREKPMLAVLAPLIALLWFLISLFAYLWFKKRAKKGTELQVNSTSTELEYFKLSTITAATNNFSLDNKLGQGGFGSVYKGLLANGMEVAIKRLSRSSGQGSEEFKNEIVVIAMLQHRNLVKLLGYCTQDGEQIGYMSPEYAVFGNFSVKSDVFSFGVMLLEIVWELWRQDKALEIVDPSLNELYHPREALKCLQIGLLCVQEDATDRPSMLAVVFMLSNETEIPSPKQPAFLFRKSDNNPIIALDVEDGQCSVNEVTISEIGCR